jgi:hypothetical protein
MSDDSTPPVQSGLIDAILSMDPNNRGYVSEQKAA